MKTYKIDQYFEFTFQVLSPLGGLSDASSTPTYRVYECDTGATAADAAIATGNCALRNSGSTDGYYHVRGQITTALGYEVGKTYEVRVFAIAGGYQGASVVGRFQVVPVNVWDSIFGGTDYLEVDAILVGGLTPEDSADLKVAMEATGGHLALILADTAELESDWANGGRLDVKLDSSTATPSITTETIVITSE